MNSWVRILYCGEHTLPDGERFRVDAPLLETIRDETNRFIGECEAHNPKAPYRLPVIREHDMRGSRDGDILKVKIAPRSPSDRTPALYALISWSSSTAKEINAGRVRNVSPRIDGAYVASWGATYGPMIREVSLTVSPVLENLGSLQETLTLKLSRYPVIENEEEVKMMQDDEEMEMNQDAASSLEAKVDQILALLEMLHTTLSRESEEELEMAQDATDPALEERLAKVEEELALSRKGRLNTKERGTQAPPSKAPRTVEDVMELGRAKGLKGTALASWAWTESQKRGIKG